MKHYKKIDENRYFIEDVIIEPTIDKDGNLTYEVPSNYIEEPFPNDTPLYKPKWDSKTKKWVEGDLTAELDAKKLNKIEEINTLAKHYKTMPMAQKINGATYYFFGGRKNAQKYKEAYDLAKNLRRKKGIVKVLSAMPSNWDNDNSDEIVSLSEFVEVTEAEITKAIHTIGLNVYNNWYKQNQLLKLIQLANSIEEVEKITWDDKSPNDNFTFEESKIGDAPAMSKVNV